jgi:hypothetical protein
MLLELSPMTRCEQVKPWNQKNSVVSKQQARFTDSELRRRRHHHASCEKDFVVSLSKIWAYAGLVEQRAKFVPPKPVHELSE